ncbi:hypothetical protein ES705_41872 [subsurface metagenome]
MAKKVKDKYMQFLRSANATQPSADTFGNVEMRTGCSVRAKLAMEIHEILLFWVPASLVNNSWVEIMLNTVEGDVIGGMTKPQSILLVEAMCRLNTGGGGWEIVAPFIYKFDPPLLIVNDSLWVGIKSNATAVANTCYCRIGYTWKTITDAEYVEALELMR